MSKLLTVVGATGTQGGSVIDAALEDQKYRIRGITRNPGSEKAKALAAKGVEVVKADLNDEQSLIAAFKDSSAIYAVTDFFEPFSTSSPEEAMKIEQTQGINLAKAASQTSSLEHYIWSTLPNAPKISNGKYNVPHFDAKARVDEFIKQDEKLLAKTSFLWVTFYASNYFFPMFTPTFMKTSGKYLQVSPAASDVPIISIGSTSANVGLFVLAALSQPSLTLPGKYILGSVETTTVGAMLSTWGKVTGHETTYMQTPSVAEYDATWPKYGLELGVMMKFWDEARDKSWSGEDSLVTAEDLGIDASKFVGIEAAFKALDWSQV